MRIRAKKGDVIVIGKYEVDVDVLRTLLDPSTRALWAVVRREDGSVQLTPYSEEHVIWLQPSDLERVDAT